MRGILEAARKIEAQIIEEAYEVRIKRTLWISGRLYLNK